jgi:tubulysin polyketide synthase-like protein
MNARQLLNDLQSRGLRLVPEGGNLAVEPAERLSDADRAAIRQAKPELLRILTPAPECIIEATFTLASAPPIPEYNAAEFPPCPVCGQVRYWLASGGRVLCGTKRCASALRFQLLALEFHQVN